MIITDIIESCKRSRIISSYDKYKFFLYFKVIKKPSNKRRLKNLINLRTEIDW